MATERLGVTLLGLSVWGPEAPESASCGFKFSSMHLSFSFLSCKTIRVTVLLYVVIFRIGWIGE